MNRLVSLTESDKDLVRTSFKPISGEKQSRLVEVGQIPRCLYFINQGYVRVFALEDGEEMTSHLNCPPGFITAFSSFIRQVPSEDCVECLTHADLLAITRDSLHQLYALSPRLTEFGRIIFEQSVAYNEQRIKELKSLTAEQRYLKLLHEHPDIIQNVPLQYIASFIGIKPESLSRIRRQIIS
ncbi:Crp/Fnr family transcriptional regulator [Fibrisoma limi]|nr:Crp/Fnr family transcriptional regulator [Fibrisoma limi]